MTQTGIYSPAILVSQYFTIEADCGYFNIDSTFNNYTEITRIDFEEEIVSGLFQMRVVNDDCDTLTITEGRFDLSP